MVRATKCSSSSGESFVSIRHLVYAGVHPNLHTTRPRTYSDIYQRSYWYNCLSWWCALGCSKHVENWNKQIWRKELFVKLVICKVFNKIHGQQNMKYTNNVSILECQGFEICTAQCQAELQYLGRKIFALIKLSIHLQYKQLLTNIPNEQRNFIRLTLWQQEQIAQRNDSFPLTQY